MQRSRLRDDANPWFGGFDHDAINLVDPIFDLIMQFDRRLNGGLRMKFRWVRNFEQDIFHHIRHPVVAKGEFACRQTTRPGIPTLGRSSRWRIPFRRWWQSMPTAPRDWSHRRRPSFFAILCSARVGKFVSAPPSIQAWLSALAMQSRSPPSILVATAVEATRTSST